MPKPPPKRIDIHDYQVSYECGIVTIVLTSRAQTHLWLFYGISARDFERGIFFRSFGPRPHVFQYVTRSTNSKEQAEEGLTTVHTFRFPWPESGSRLFHYFANLADANATTSRSPIFALDLEFGPTKVEQVFQTGILPPDWSFTGDPGSSYTIGPGIATITMPPANFLSGLTWSINPFGLGPRFGPCDSYIAFYVWGYTVAEPFYEILVSADYHHNVGNLVFTGRQVIARRRPPNTPGPASIGIASRPGQLIINTGQVNASPFPWQEIVGPYTDESYLQTITFSVANPSTISPLSGPLQLEIRYPTYGQRAVTLKKQFIFWVKTPIPQGFTQDFPFVEPWNPYIDYP